MDAVGEDVWFGCPVEHTVVVKITVVPPRVQLDVLVRQLPAVSIFLHSHQQFLVVRVSAVVVIVARSIVSPVAEKSYNTQVSHDGIPELTTADPI